MASNGHQAWVVIILSFFFLFDPTAAQHRDAPTVWNASISRTSPVDFSLFRRLEKGRCDKDNECVGGECCNADSGYCGLDADHCTKPACVSNCDAKADCGSWAKTAGTECPLNVCCGKSGYCGTTEDFCSTELGCQSNCPQPGSTGLNTGDVTNIVIGYYEGWAPFKKGGCSSRDPGWIPKDSITHLYVAFAYIEPDSYQIVPMEGTSEKIFRDVLNLKETAPGLRIYVSLGGWTYSDNGTDTQSVWGDLASTAAKRTKFITNLVNFMTDFGFDGVDLDWEYPGASDRGGLERDTENYVSLVRDIRTFWTAHSNGWGLSFTAPTSYWYLRWFDIESMAKYVDWINLMTYDLHGSWDSPEDQIGSFVYAHTNMTEITSALDLFWRNNVPANKINLGLGFYGRSFTLEDPSCTLPGCPFTEGGRAEACSGESGILSYKEISRLAALYNIEPVEDDAAAAMYFAFDQDQWVSYDNVKTIKEKVDYANKNGLLGLFIWALDLDTDDYEALNAVLDSKGGLGAFREQNGVGPSDSTSWQPLDGSCHLSECSSSSACSGSYMSVGSQIRCDDENEHRWVCCPRDNAPDAGTCTWRASLASWSGKTSAPCVDDCMTDEILVVKSPWYIEEGQGDRKCSSGVAQYCCKTTDDSKVPCGMLADSCISITDGKPSGDDPCAANGQVFLTYSQDTCPDGSWRPWCCDDAYDSGGKCGWQGPDSDKTDESLCENAKTCENQINIGVSKKGGGSDCTHHNEVNMLTNPVQGVWTLIDYPKSYERALCCLNGDEVVYNQTSPVPLAWLFPDPIPDSDEQEFTLDVEADADDDSDPNENGFGFVIMSGPDKDLTTLDKRDGSHWELFDCPDRTAINEEDRVAVRAVCTDDSSESNCDKIFMGGVARTVVEMPRHCGIGRYAMAVSMEPGANQTVPGPLVKKLVKRGVNLKRGPPVVYDFIFDYDFSVLHGRSDSDVQVRVDYSEDPGYWEAFVNQDPASDPESKKRKRDVELEVIREHGGSWKRYFEDRFRREKRETPPHRMHEFHKRYFSDDPTIWLKFQEALDTKEFSSGYDLGTHHIESQVPFYLFNEELQCTLLGVPYTAYFMVWADLHIDIQTSALLTLIGRLNDLSSFKESHVLFRNKGSIQAGLHMEAQAQLRFSTGRLELFGMPNFAGNFEVPGLVKIGPNLRITGELTGTFTAHTQAHYNLELPDWDYTQRYPNDNDDVLSGLTATSKMDGIPGAAADAGKPGFYADVGVDGDITLKITPLVEFGVRWNPKWKVQDTVISLQLATYATLYGSVGVSTVSDAEVCYGAICGAELFAQLEGPTIFGVNPNRRWSFFQRDIPIIEETCQPLSNFLPSTCTDCDD